jgi:hypothetical protein
MGFHSESRIDDDTYDIDVDSWTSFDGDDEDYCYSCEDWTDNDGHGNCKECGCAFDKIEGDAWATAHTTKTSVASAPTISTSGDVWGRGSGFTWGGGTSWWHGSGSSSLSSMWGGYSTFSRGNDDAYRLMKHKRHLDSLCKVVDPTVKHTLQFSSHNSGHTNMKTGSIVIDGDLLKDSDDNLDITAGLAIHEKLHLVYSQELMKAESDMRSRLCTTQGQSMLLHDICNIIEDEYIEKQLSTTAKGFVHYIEKCKKHYFEDSFKDIAKPSEAFTDLINTFMLFVRYPSLIDDDRRKRHAPHIRFFARTMSDALDSRDNTYVAIETIYSYLLKAFDKMSEGDSDKALDEAMSKADDKVDDMMAKFEESGVSISDDEWATIRDRLKAEFMEEAKRTEKYRDKLEDAMREADKLISKLTGEDYSGGGHLDESLLKEIKDLEDSDYTEYDMDKGLAISGSQRKITWQKASAPEYASEIYREAKTYMKKEISKLKKKIQLYGNSEKFTIRNQKRGKIDKRMLHRIPSGRMDLFKTEITKEDKPLDICLLVDESGSMGSYTMRQARNAAISIKEALSDNDRLNLWVFGHSADEYAKGNTEMIEYWSPSMKDRPMAMGGMRARYENRDGNAIIASADRVRSESTQPKAKKLMIVLSDGQPSADRYRGWDAEKHTKKCVKNVESKGWDIIQVGFAGMSRRAMADMFSNYIYVDDSSKLGDKVSKIIRKVLKI